MILDSLRPGDWGDEVQRRLLLGFDYLRALPANPPVGRVEIEGDRVFCLIQEYTSTPPSERPYESHRRYADIQAMVSGREAIYYAPIASLHVQQPYRPENDCILYTGADVQPLYMEPGTYAVFWPQDGHKPGCVWETPQPVRKAVLKILLQS